MQAALDLIEQLHQRTQTMDAAVASEFSEALAGIRRCVLENVHETDQLTMAQADAIVHSAEIIAELEETKEKLQAAQTLADSANQSKSEFLANMSHEIRTPMTAILGFSEALLDPSMSDDEKRTSLSTIQRNGEHLLEIINDILDLSKVESGKLIVESRRTNPGSILREIYELFSERAKAHGNVLEIAIQGDIPQQIRTDPTRLKQALLNLVGNAIKFTKNGRVRLIAACERQEERMIYRVEDSGSGMTKEQLGRIFEPFKQADTSTTRVHGGTGLGLTITKRIAELLGGGVRVESEFGRGSLFTLEIATGPLAGVQMVSAFAPLNGDSVPELDGASSPSNRVEGRVLLVEDGPDNQRLVSFFLNKLGATVTVATNGKEGLEAALDARTSSAPFDLILMDMQMPVMDGYTATASLRREGYTGQIVALTAHAMKGEIDKCIAAGCDAYLSKPIDRETFIREVSHRIRLSTSPSLT